MTETPPPSTPAALTKQSAGKSFLISGLIPVILFTVIEDKYGPLWGLIAGMVFGVGELLYEKIRFQQISKITWIGNGMILVLGSVSLISADGIYFKLQPAFMEIGFTLFLWISYALKKNPLFALMKAQNPQIPDMMEPLIKGMSLRLGLFFFIHAIVATYAAFYWSTTAWALLKGVGLTVTLIGYMIGEGLYLRKILIKK